MKNLNFLAVCLFFFVSSSWASCQTENVRPGYCYHSYYCCATAPANGMPACTYDCNRSNLGYINGKVAYQGDLTGFTSNSCSGGSGYENNWETSSYGYIPVTYCSTTAEADSMACVLNPNASGCKSPQQTCEESGKYWYNDTCNDNPQCTQADSTWQQCAYFFKEDSLGNVNRVAIENTYTRTSCVTNTLAEVADSCSNTPTINDSTSCDTLGGFWYDNACNDKPKTCNYIDSTCIYNGGEFTLKSFSGDSTCIYECVKGENTNPVQLMTFNASTTPSQTSYALKSNYSVGSVTSVVTKQDYDFVDSLMGVQCSNHLYRGIKNGKYIYWYNNQAIPDSVTHIVKVY